MTYKGYLHAAPTLEDKRLPWLLFLLLSVAFFFLFHDLSHLKYGIGDYNLPLDDLVISRVQGSLVHRIALLLLGSGSLVSLLRHRSDGRLRINSLFSWALLSVVLWTVISPIWADEVSWALKGLVNFLVLSIAAVAVLRRFSMREIILWTFLSGVVSLVIGIAAEVLLGTFAPFTSGYRFGGGLHPNSQGIECGLLVLSAVTAAGIEERWRMLYRAGALLGFTFLILSGSRTALAATILALVAYVVQVRSRRWKIAATYGLTIIACFLFLFLWTGLLPGLKSAVLLGRDNPDTVDSFSGRTMIWKDVGYYIRQRPILGYGWGGFWTPAHISVISDEENAGIPNGHSIYIDCLLSLGIVGLVGYSCVLFAGITRAFRYHTRSQNPVFAFCVAALAFCALDGLFESTMLGEGDPMFLTMLILGWLAFAVRAEPARPIDDNCHQYLGSAYCETADV